MYDHLATISGRLHELGCGEQGALVQRLACFPLVPACTAVEDSCACKLCFVSTIQCEVENVCMICYAY
jgi:hypothetical protein